MKIEAKNLPAKFAAHELTNEKYHAASAISRSALMTFLECPYKFYANYLSDDKPAFEQTSAMILGSALHTYVLEPDLFDKTYAALPERVLLKDVGRETYDAYKAKCEEIEAGDKQILTLEQMNQVRAMGERIKSHDIYELIKDGECEASYFWEDAHSGLALKARPDVVTHNAVIDLKTTASADARSFQLAMVKYGYHIQGAMCLEALSQVENRHIDTVINVCIEKSYPYAIAVYIIDVEALNVGHQKFKRGVLDIAHCMSENTFTDYKTQMISLPAWSIDD